MLRSKVTLLLILTIAGCSRRPSPARILHFSCDELGCRSLASKPSPPLADDVQGHFAWGEIDLTGDGVAEGVLLDEEQVVILEAGAEAWRSPAEWRVVDLALGDPNDDGRNEVLVVLWKRNESGVERNHPFIVGHRGGYYRELWGGSAVAVPIHEVALGDVDGDATQELIVLEEAGPGSQRTVAVWRWNQWWFNVVWRSPVGCYSDLALIPGEGESDPPVIQVRESIMPRDPSQDRQGAPGTRRTARREQSAAGSR